MVGDSRKGGRTILTNVVYGWFHGGQSLANTAQGYRQDSDGTYYGRIKVSLNDDPKTQMVVYFHTDNPDNPQWVALRTPWSTGVTQANIHKGYFNKPIGYWLDNEQFLFFEPSDVQGSGSGAQTWGLLSGVLAGEDRITSEERYVNHGFERYQDVNSNFFRAAINRAKI